jgi:predicted esterase
VTRWTHAATRSSILAGLVVVACAGARPLASTSSSDTEPQRAGEHGVDATRARRDVTGDASARDAAGTTSTHDVPSGVLLLPVEGFEPAVVVAPPDARAVPLLVATHGAGGTPEWECERWAKVAKNRWFLLCPRGTALRRGEAGSYYYPDHHALEREVRAAVDAARGTFGARLASEHGVYVGYSQGATMGALMLVDHGAPFPHLLLIEGGSGDWTLARAQRFRATGGKSVFIVCGTEGCAQRAARAKPVLERAGLTASVEVTPGGGHTELGEVGTRAEKLLETLVFR